MFSKTKQRLAVILALVCAICLAFGISILFTNTESAVISDAETTDTTVYTEVSTESALTSAISTSGAYKLTADITLSSTLTISDSAEVIIDLNGHTIATASNSEANAIEVASSASLTINDNTGNGIITGYWNGIYNVGTLTVNAGTITGTPYQGIYNEGTLTVNGGTVKGNYNGVYSEGSVIVNDGTLIGTNNNGIYDYEGTVTINGGALNGGDSGLYTYYAEDTINGGTITGANNGICNYEGSTITVNGGSMTGTAYNGIECYSGTITVNGGSITGNTYNGIFVNDAYAGASTITVNGGTITGAEAGLIYFGNGSTATPTVINVTGGSITGSSTFGLAGNGEKFYSSVTITGGTIEGGDVGYYHPEDGTLTMTGGSITGVNAGLQVCAGTIEISGGTFKATADATTINQSSANNTNKTGNGSIDDGAALSIINRSGYGNGDTSVASVTVTGGVFSSDSTVESVQAYNFSEADKGSAFTTDETKSIVTITGGTYSSDLSTGTYSNYCLAEGLTTSTQNGDGTYGMALTTTAQTTYGSSKVLLITSAGVSGYDTVTAALTNAGTTNVTIWLNDDITEDITIPADLNVTLDLCGHSITNISSHTITVGSGVTLSVYDTVGGGKVDNVTHATAAIYSETTTATVVLNGGTFTRSKEAGVTGNNGGNSFYTLVNHGTMIINDGVTVSTKITADDGSAVGYYSSLIENGWQNGSQNSDKTNSYLIINGGTFIGGNYNVKCDDWGVVTIYNGTFQDGHSAAVLSYNITTIEDGDFSTSSGYTIWAYYGDDTMDQGVLTITGGSFTSTTGYAIRSVSGADVTIEDGEFSGKVYFSSSSSYEITGGTYDATAAASVAKYLTANTALEYDATSGTYTAKVADVKVTATSGDKAFYDDSTTALEQALEYITTAGAGTYTIALGNSYTLDSTLTIAEGYDVTLDLNGNTLTSDSTVTIQVNSGAVLTIEDSAGGGVVENTSKYTVYDRGTLTINGGTFINSAAKSSSNYVIVTSADATFTMNGGTVTAVACRAVYCNYTGIVIINDGLIEACGYAAVYSYGSVTVNGGTIRLSGDSSSAARCIYNRNDTENNSISTVIINGGTIDASAQTSAKAQGIYTEKGTVTVNGGTIIGGSYPDDTSAAIATTGAATVDIAGGTLSGYNGVYLSSSATATIGVNGGESLPAISGTENGIYNLGTTINIYSGTITAGGTYAVYSSVNIYGGVISGGEYGVFASTTAKAVNVYGGTISGTSTGIYANGTTNISGGSVSGAEYGIWATSSLTITGGSISSSQVGVYTTATTKITDATITVTGNGKADGGYDSTNWVYGVLIKGNKSLTVNDGTVITATNSGQGSAGIVYYGSGSASSYVTVTINGGSISGGSYGITGNGNNPYSKVTINGGSIEGGATGYYHPEDGTLTITGGSLTGEDAALELRSGSLTITGGTFTSTSTTFYKQSNNSGTTIIGAAIAISQHTTNNEIDVDISGGTFSGYYALYETDTTGDGDTDDISITLTGGSYTSTNPTYGEAVASTSMTTGFISGGTYNTNVSSYCATGYTVSENNGTYGVTLADSKYVAVHINDGSTFAEAYATLEEALAYIYGDGVTSYGISTKYPIEIRLYSDLTLSSSIIFESDYDITLNLDGYNLTFESGCTLTNNGTLTIESGSAASVAFSGAKGIINNGTLTITENVTVSNKYKTTSSSDSKIYGIYNYGTLVIDGGIITTEADSSGYSTTNTYAIYNDAGSVTLDSGTISSTNSLNVAYGIYNNNGGDVTINGGTIDMSANTEKAAHAICQYTNSTLTVNGGIIKGGTFASTTAASCGSAIRVIAVSTVEITGGTLSGYYGVYLAANATVNIAGGTISSTSCCVYLNNASAKLNVSGGYFDNTTAIYVSKGAAEVTGGYFKDAGAAAYSAESYALTSTADGESYYQVLGYSSYAAVIGNIGYATLQDAVAAVADGTQTTITVVGDIDTTTAVEISSGKDIILDLNGNTVTVTGSATAFNTNLANFINNGTLTIIDNGTDGELNVSTVIIGLYNAGTLNLNGGTVVGEWLNGGTTANSYAIYNAGTITVNGGNVESNLYGIYNASTGTVTVTKGTITADSTSYTRAIYNYGQVVLSDGTLSSSYIGIQNAGTVTINGGSVSGTSFAIFNNATLIINDGEISSSGSAVINNGTLTVDGGTITGTTNGIQNQSTGNATISNGTIYGGTCGVINTSSNSLAISNGVISGTYGVYNYNGTATITGGTIKGSVVAIYTSATLTVSGNTTITTAGDSSGWVFGIEVDAGGKLTINDDVSVNATNASGSAAGVVYFADGTVENPVVVVINGGTIYGSIYGISGNGSTSNYSDVTINGGDITGGEMGYYHPESGTLKITDGSITGKFAALQICSGEITITGGTFTTTATAAEIAADSNNPDNKTGDGAIADGGAISIINRGYSSVPEISISGGTFVSASGNSVTAYSFNTTDHKTEWDEAVKQVSVSGGSYTDTSAAAYAASGSILCGEQNSEGYYTVEATGAQASGTIVASIGDLGYTSLGSALSAASDGDTIKILEKITLDATLTISGNVIIDLNGKMITSSASHTITVESGATLTVMDSSTGGLIENTASYYAVYNSGTVVIESGTVSSSGTFAVYNAASGTVEIAGGTVSGSRGVRNGGNFIMTSGYITTTTYYALYNTGTALIEGGNISSGGFTVYSNNSLTITGGTITASYGDTLRIEGGTAVIGEKDGNDDAITISSTSANSSDIVIGINYGAELSIYSGTITSTGIGISVQGTSAEAYSKLYVYGGKITAASAAIITNGNDGIGYAEIYISGGTVTSTDATAVYLPAQYGKTVISGDAEITGATGVEVRNGSLSITGGEITSTVTEASGFSAVPNSNGSTVIGAAVAVSTYNETGVSVNVSGGTLTGYYALYEANVNEYTLSQTIAIAVIDGTFAGSISSEDVLGFISGGSYSDASAAAYVADGYMLNGSTSGYYGIVLAPEKVETAVASVNGIGYTSLEGAISAASDGDTVKLETNITGSVTISENKTITLDLNGYTLTNSASSSTIILESGSLTIVNGTVYNNTGSTDTPAIYVYSGAELTLGSGAIVSGYVGIRSGNGELGVGGVITVGDGAEVTGTYAGIMTYGDLTVNDGATITGGFGIVIYGRQSGDRTQIVINGGTITGTENAAISSYGIDTYGYVDLYIKGGTIIGEGATSAAVYLPATDGKTYISGGVITGVASGVEIRAGSLTITDDATITATAKTFSATANGNGETVVGAAVAISQHTTNKDISVTISGGTLSGIYAVYEIDTYDKNVSNISVSLTDGTYSGSIYSQNEIGFISGGTYSELPSDSSYYASGKIPSYTSATGGTIVNGTFVAAPDADTTTYTYDTTSKTYSLKEDSGYTIDGATQTYAGTYTVEVKLNEGYVWSDGTTAAKEYTFVINRAQVDAPEADGTTFIYTGSAQTYNLTQGTLYTISDNTTQTNAGTYTITVELNDSNNYMWYDGTTGEISYTFTIAKAPNSVFISISGWTYGGTVNEAQVHSNFGTADVRYYSDAALKNEVTDLAAATAGTYYVVATVDETTDYSGATKTASFVITAATLSATLSGATEVTYDGTAHSVTVTASVSGAEVLYGTTENSCTESTAPSYTDAAEYTVYYQITATGYETLTGSYTLTINKVDITLTATSQTVSYGTDAITYGYTMTGSLVNSGDLGTIAATSSYTQATEVGTLEITVTYRPNNNYNVAVEKGTLTVSQAANALTGTLTMDGWTYGGTASEPAGITGAEFGYAYITYLYSTSVNGEYTDVKPSAAGTYYVKAYIAGTKNYTEVSAIAGFTIAAVDITISADSLSVTYGDAVPSYTYTIKGSLVSENDLGTITARSSYTSTTGVGSYEITVSYTANDNYNVTVVSGTITVNKAINTLTGTLSMDGWTYGGTQSSPSEVSAAFGNVVYLYSNSVDGTYSETKPSAAGSYYVKAYVEGTANYSEVSAIASFTIAKVHVDAPEADADSYSYLGTEITYVLKESELYTVSGEKQTEAGTYTVTVTLKDTDNYDWSDGTTEAKTYEFVIAEAEITVTAEGYSGSYDAAAHTGSVSAETVDGTAYTVAYGTAEGTYDLESAPAYTAAGTYVVYYKVTAENHTALEGSFTVTIEAITAEAHEDNNVAGTISSDNFVIADVTAEINVVTESYYDVSAEEIAEAVTSAVEEAAAAEVIAVYDVSLSSGGSAVTVAEATEDGKVDVTIAIPTALAGQSFYIVHMHDGEIVEIITAENYSVANGSVTFTVEKLSQFAFVMTSSESSDGADGAASAVEQYITIALFVGTLVAILLVVVVIGMACTGKKRKHRKH